MLSKQSRPGYALQAARNGIVRRPICRPRGHCSLARIALARADTRPRMSLFRSAWDFMAEMEATMTWKAPPSGSYLLARGAYVFVAREADIFRILSKRTGVI